MLDWRIAGVAFKVHAACRHTHSAVDAALELRSKNAVTTDQIDSVHVQIYEQALDLLDGMEPSTPYAAKFSLPFCIATALEFGDLGPNRFTDETIQNHSTLALADRVSFSTDPNLDAAYPEAWPSVVSVRLIDGIELTARVDHPAGDIETGVKDSDLSSKFARMTSFRFTDAAEDVAAQLLNATQPMTASEVVKICCTGKQLAITADH